MKTMNYILMTALALTLTACGGGGGGGGGGPTPNPPGGGGGPDVTGTASFINASDNMPGVTCMKDGQFKSTTPATESECVANNGTWNPAVMVVATGDRCVINSITYSYSPGGTASSHDQDVCSAFGGTYQASTNMNVTSCTGHTATCASLGGTEVTVHSVSGDTDDLALVNGNNTVTGETGAFGLSCAIQSGNGKMCNGDTPTEKPILFQTTSRIKNGANVVRWSASLTRATGTSFSGYTGNSTDTTSFTLNMPVATETKQVNGTDEHLVIEGATLYYTP